MSLCLYDCVFVCSSVSLCLCPFSMFSCLCACVVCGGVTVVVCLCFLYFNLSVRVLMYCEFVFV